eukprot:28646_1
MEALESHPKVPVSRKSLRRSGLKDPYNLRPLPFVIGTSEFLEDPLVGLAIPPEIEQEEIDEYADLNETASELSSDSGEAFGDGGIPFDRSIDEKLEMFGDEQDKLNFEDELVVPLFKKPKKDRPDSSSPAQSSKDQQKSPKKPLNITSGLFGSESDEDFFGESMPSHRKKPGKSLFDGEEEEDLPMQPETVEPSLPTEMIGDLFADDVEEDLFALLGKADTEKETWKTRTVGTQCSENSSAISRGTVDGRPPEVQHYSWA